MKLGRIFAPAVIALGVSGCVQTYGNYNEDANYNGQRTPIQSQPMRCDVYSSESGYVQGGSYVFNGGSAVRNCVSTSGTQQAQEAMQNVTNLIYQAQNLRYALGM